MELAQLGSGVDAELGEHVPEVVAHGAVADPQLYADLAIRQLFGGQLGDSLFLGGEPVHRPGVRASPASRLSGEVLLALRALAQRLGTEPVERLQGGADPDARIGPQAVDGQSVPTREVPDTPAVARPPTPTPP
ncbi:hypothetical protein [Streptomyces sp. 43Y-GA-1]|uniref:hypothetical protein n=1 Tax=Streptomyces sp. 43Y-GA-1 TaxID=2939435 RepID=UPI0020C09BE5|nr:hypothetical protein [Streptomyces sp. 43Y-GA-1]MCL6288103.1 hypothetical protein [Streptomyces sp. 43Y-GA-1]